MNDSVIDVLIPVFNVQKTVHSAIQSIQNQTIANIKIIVVDDGSTDETKTILASLAAGDPRIQVITKPNGGIVDALNTGLSKCRATYVARHDGDDLAQPDRFERQLAYLKGHPDCIAISSNARQINDTGKNLGTVTNISNPDRANAHWFPAREPYLLHPFLMTYRSALVEVGGYRYCHHAEDSDLYWRLQDIGRLHSMSDLLGDYRIAADSITGVSVVNGRVSALNSQLSALSVRRRQAGRPELTFEKEMAKACSNARTLANIFCIGTKQLDPIEIEWLELALAAKMLELAGYRPYELDVQDCKFIHDSMRRQLQKATPDNKVDLLRMWAGTSSRLLSRGLVKEAFALASIRIYFIVIIKLLFRIILPSKIIRLLRRRSGRSSYFK